MEQEIWKDIAGYEGLYQVSSLGRVKSHERTTTQSNGKIQPVKERILKPGKDAMGYLHVRLFKNGVANLFKIHRLVANAFIPNDDLFATTVNHIDEDKTNNRVSNLEWMSHGDNTRYSNAGSKNWKAKSVRCIETGQVFGCAVDASRWLGLSIHAVDIAIRRGHCSGGYHWEYI